MTHEDIKTLISAYLDNETTPAETRMVEEHLKTCVECQKDFRIYKSMSSSLAKWPNETLSPDEEINVQKHLEPRREPMFTQRTATLLTTTIALGLLIGSVLQMELKHGVQGHLKSDGSIPFMETFSAKKEPASEYKPSYLSGPYRTMSMAGAAPAQWLGAGAQKSAYYSADANTSLGRLDAANVPAVVREQLMGKTLNSAPVVPVNAQFAATPDLQSMYYQNSGYYSGTDVDRKKIRQADIDLRVENAFKTKSQLTDLILQSNGIVLNSVFNRTDDGSGHGTMICKVYPKDLEHLLQQIRGLGEVERENESSIDVTDQYNDVQNDLDKYKLEKENLQKTLDKFKLFNPTTDEERANIQAQISRLKREIALNERMIKSYEEQTGMSVVTINFYDQFKNTARDTTPTWQKMIADEWQNTKITAIMIFTRIFFKVVYLFSYIAPLALWIGIFWVIYLVLRLFRKK